jgi:predicted enzyme related to lactoylglutathione lyase
MDRAVAFYEPVMQVTLRRETMDCAELAVFPHQDRRAPDSILSAGFVAGKKNPGRLGRDCFISTEPYWFEIPVADMDRAVAFYEPVMQVTLRRETMDCAELAIRQRQRPENTRPTRRGDAVECGGKMVCMQVNNSALR